MHKEQSIASIIVKIAFEIYSTQYKMILMKSEKECGAILLSFQTQKKQQKKKWRNSHIKQSIIR